MRVCRFQACQLPYHSALVEVLGSLSSGRVSFNIRGRTFKTTKRSI